jgi:hypothetical protein
MKISKRQFWRLADFHASMLKQKKTAGCSQSCAMTQNWKLIPSILVILGQEFGEKIALVQIVTGAADLTTLAAQRLVVPAKVREG